MDSTTFPVHTFALLTPEDEEVLADESPALGTLIFVWGLRDADLKLITPLHRYTAEGIDPVGMIGLGKQLIVEGERLKALSNGPAGTNPGSGPDESESSGSSASDSAVLVPEIELPPGVVRALAGAST